MLGGGGVLLVVSGWLARENAAQPIEGTAWIRGWFSAQIDRSVRMRLQHPNPDAISCRRFAALAKALLLVLCKLSSAGVATRRAVLASFPQVAF